MSTEMITIALQSSAFGASGLFPTISATDYFTQSRTKYVLSPEGRTIKSVVGTPSILGDSSGMNTRSPKAIVLRIGTPFVMTAALFNVLPMGSYRAELADLVTKGYVTIMSSVFGILTANTIGSYTGGGLIVYSNITRPNASTVPKGTEIFNSDDNAPNYSDGVAHWYDASGNIT
jgi:hypothetical protein